MVYRHITTEYIDCPGFTVLLFLLGNSNLIVAITTFLKFYSLSTVLISALIGKSSLSLNSTGTRRRSFLCFNLKAPKISQILVTKLRVVQFGL